MLRKYPTGTVQQVTILEPGRKDTVPTHPSTHTVSAVLKEPKCTVVRGHPSINSHVTRSVL